MSSDQEAMAMAMNKYFTLPRTRDTPSAAVLFYTRDTFCGGILPLFIGGYNQLIVSPANRVKREFGK